MIQKTIRPYSGNSFTPTEAAEWLKELDDRTKSSKIENNSIDEISGAVKTVVSNTLKFSDTIKGKEHGTWDNPIVGDFIIDPTENVNGGWVEGVYRGGNVNITGVASSLVKSMTKLPSKQGDYKYAIRWLGGRYELWVLVGINNISIPSNLSAGTPTNTTIPLTWTKSPSSGITEYRVYNNGTFLKTFGDVSIGTLTGLTSGMLHNLTIRAFDGTNESGDSNAVVVTTLGAPSGNSPLAPSIGTITEYTITASGTPPLVPSIGTITEYTI